MREQRGKKTIGRWWAGWLGIGLIMAGGFEPALAEPRTALVIGNAAYTSFNRLTGTINDAKDLATELQKLGFEVIWDTDLNQRAFRTKVNQFADRLKKRGGSGLFYFSGHGAQVRGKNYLVPVDLDAPGGTITGADVRDGAISADWVLEKMTERGEPKFNLMILDACRNEPKTKAAWGGGGGLAPMVAPAGTLIAYATAPGTLSADGPRNSLYTARLLEALRNTPRMEIKSLFQSIRSSVIRDSEPLVDELGAVQVPWEAVSMTSDFHFAGKDLAVVPRPPAGQIFRDTLSDGTRGPALVVIPAGQFWMGSPEGETGRDSDERRHRVSVATFALGQTEVTVGEFRRFVEATGHRTDAERNADGKEGCYVADREGSAWKYGYRASMNWKNPNFQQGAEHPVVCVSWNDAVAYTDWLSKQMGQDYRLPTEAEWEYAARAGTETARYWGDDPDRACRNANVRDRTAKETFSDWTIHDCSDGYVYAAPVGSFTANGFGLRDMLGNVWEWTCSMYERNENYSGPETKCANNSTIGARAVRGGAWFSEPAGVRSANRSGLTPSFRLNNRGFRLARSL